MIVQDIGNGEYRFLEVYYPPEAVDSNGAQIEAYRGFVYTRGYLEERKATIIDDAANQVADIDAKIALIDALTV